MPFWTFFDPFWATLRQKGSLAPPHIFEFFGTDLAAKVISTLNSCKTVYRCKNNFVLQCIFSLFSDSAEKQSKNGENTPILPNPPHRRGAHMLQFTLLSAWYSRLKGFLPLNRCPVMMKRCPGYGSLQKCKPKALKYPNIKNAYATPPGKPVKILANLP